MPASNRVEVSQVQVMADTDAAITLLERTFITVAELAEALVIKQTKQIINNDELLFLMYYSIFISKTRRRPWPLWAIEMVSFPLSTSYEYLFFFQKCYIEEKLFLFFL